MVTCRSETPPFVSFAFGAMTVANLLFITVTVIHVGATAPALASVPLPVCGGIVLPQPDPEGSWVCCGDDQNGEWYIP
jgi:hypothetical protein